MRSQAAPAAPLRRRANCAERNRRKRAFMLMALEPGDFGRARDFCLLLILSLQSFFTARTTSAASTLSVASLSSAAMTQRRY